MTDPHPEDLPDPLPDGEDEPTRFVPPEGAEYGYFDDRPYPSTRGELIARLREGRPTPGVWTPETMGVVPPWTVPYLFAAFREHGMRHARRVGLFWGLVCVALAVVTAVRTEGALLDSPTVVFAFIAGVLAFHSFLEYRSFRGLTPDRIRTEVREVRKRPPPRAGPAVYTRTMAVALVALFVTQILVGWEPSIAAAGIIKYDIRYGETYRLLTGALLHGEVIHFAFNFMALLALGRMMEAYAHRAFVPLVFLLTALAASAASVAFAPHVDSVGSSGGLMGLFGFLGVMGWRRRHLMPPGFARAVLVDVAVIAAMGVVGYQFIDNAAHGGGFLAGALLGLLTVPTRGTTPYWEPPRYLRRAGDVSLAVLLLAAAATLFIILRYNAIL